MDRREATLQHRASLGELALLVDRNALRRIVRMRHDHVLDAGSERRVDGAVDLRAAEVSRREHDVVARDDVEHLREAAVHQLHGLASHAGGDELLLNRPPHRLLRRLGAVLARLVLGVDRRQPDDPRTAAGRDLDRLRVEPADARVERDRAEDIDTRHGVAHDGRALRRRRVVRLEHEPGKPELGEPAREPEVVDPPLREIRLDVDVEVVRAADELTRASRRLNGRRRQATPPPRQPEEFP